MVNPPPLLRRIGFFLLCLLSVGVAGYAFVVYGFLPLGSAVHPDMQAAFESHRVGIMTHVLCSALTLLIGPIQFLQGFRRRHSRWHRVFGRTYLGLGVLLGGISGLYMSWFAFGGWVSTLGFGALGVVWLASGYQVFATARSRNFPAHWRWVVRNFSLSFGAVTLRIYLGLGFASGLDFEVFYPYLAWVSWVPNLIVAEGLIRSRRDVPSA